MSAELAPTTLAALSAPGWPRADWQAFAAWYSPAGRAPAPAAPETLTEYVRT